MSIISNNCYGTAYSKATSKEYTTPFFSLFLYGEDYVTLLENFDELIAMDPVICEDNVSKYFKTPKKYPILRLGEVEIHCLHDKGKTPEESRAKWIRRRDRMDMDKSMMVVKFCDRDKFNLKLAERFLALDQFPRKVLFISQKWAKDLGGLPGVVVTEELKKCKEGPALEKTYPISSIFEQ